MIIGTIKGIFVILSFYMFALIMWKLISIVKLVKSTFKEGTILESLKSFSREEFVFLCKKLLEREGFGNFTELYDDFFICDKAGKSYGLMLNNEEDGLNESDIKYFYGYMILNNLQGVIVMSIGPVDEIIKNRVEKSMGIEFISYGVEDFGGIYRRQFAEVVTK